MKSYLQTFSRLRFLPALLLGVVIQFAMLSSHAEAAESPELPTVLLVGDSISVAYTPMVQKSLLGTMQVERVKGNCRYSSWGAEHAQEWVKDKHWDIIHFNFGLWDLYGWKQDKFISVEDYGKNLEAIVGKLKPACDLLIFATTTPPCAEPEHKIKVLVTAEKAAAFEAEARRIMKQHGVLVNDLDDMLADRMELFGRGASDVHYNEAGNALIAKKVAGFLDMSVAALPAVVCPVATRNAAIPYGKVMLLDGEIVDGNIGTKASEGLILFRVDSVNGENIAPQKCPFSVHHVADKAKFVSVKKIGSKLSVRAYLTGGYGGIPEGVGAQDQIWQDTSFHFSSQLMFLELKERK